MLAGVSAKPRPPLDPWRRKKDWAVDHGLWTVLCGLMNASEMERLMREQR